MEKLMKHAIIFADNLSQKQTLAHLNEFEYLCFEQLSKTITAYMLGLEYAYKKNTYDLEIELDKARIAHEEYLRNLENLEGKDKKEDDT